ncbi:MAG: radical SAM/Cys-rich domain protein [Halobacteria archaeon]|nr:radical SAM/Cys-rich domain protein [Halobacteria archaeon]
MHATLPLLQHSDFPALSRARLETLQVNVGYLCNQSCLHCHVNAGPKRTEIMDADTVEDIIRFLDRSELRVLDLTGGAPELNPHFRKLVLAARARGLDVIDRCNLTVLLTPGQEDTAAFMAHNQVKIVASLPCYLKENVEAQRGDGTFDDSLAALRRLNELGYGKPGSGRVLDLVYNPQGPVLPPAQQALEADYRQHLDRHYGIGFNNLLTLANMPIKRFGSTLVSRDEFDGYMRLLKHAYRNENLDSVMCRTLISVDWRGYVYDCDFNQMLGLPIPAGRQGKIHINELAGQDIRGRAINVADHCYGCTAGQGSGCGGALV